MYWASRSRCEAVLWVCKPEVCKRCQFEAIVFLNTKNGFCPGLQDLEGHNLFLSPCKSSAHFHMEAPPGLLLKPVLFIRMPEYSAKTSQEYFQDLCRLSSQCKLQEIANWCLFAEDIDRGCTSIQGCPNTSMCDFFQHRKKPIVGRQVVCCTHRLRTMLQIPVVV